MPRRVSLPAADDLFRPTAVDDATSSGASVRAVPDQPEDDGSTEAASSGDSARSRARKPSGRVRHDEKMTVYVTSDELLDLEHARLSLRRSHGLAVDRGRLVREAVALVLADLEVNGDDSALVRRLTQG
ncbi:hypothetical protein [Nocardioides sp.]|uniref:hypothetical protein n=1 Tax=Nocardioides sp. TaxID=35761 RepID=UPI003567D2F2